MFKKVLITLLGLMIMLSGCGNDQKKDMISIGVIQFAKHSALDAAYDGFVEELDALGYKKDVDYTIDYQNAQGDIITADTIATKLVNAKHDLIYAIATPAAQAVASKTSEIPIIISAVSDPESAGLVKSNDLVESNVSGVSDLTPVKRQIELLNEIMDAKNVAIMYANSEDNSRFQADIAKAELEKLDINYIDASVSESNQISQVLDSLINKVDAIYVPTDNLISDSIATVAEFAKTHNIVTVVGEVAMVVGGGLITDGVDYKNIGKKAGAMAYDILVKNVDIKTTAIVYMEDDDLELAVNISTMEILNLKLSDQILENALIIE